MMPKRAFGTGKTISKNVVYSSFSRPESARRILSVIFGTASNICLHFVASSPLIYKTILFYTPTVKKQCLINLETVNEFGILVLNLFPCLNRAYITIPQIWNSAHNSLRDIFQDQKG